MENRRRTILGFPEPTVYIRRLPVILWECEMKTETIFVFGVTILLLCSCGGSGSGMDGGIDASADADSDSDADSDTDTDSDADADTDSDTDTDTDSDAGGDSGPPMTVGDYTDPRPVTWVFIDGGVYRQGSESSLSPASWSETPARDVTVPSFEIMTTEVTTAQYAQCVLAAACEEPLTIQSDGSGAECNWLNWGREDHPVNCVNVAKAKEYCGWIGGRLPTESEWEYAARSCGQDIEYPWGGDTASCSFAVVVLPNVDEGCGLGRTWPICSIPAGNTQQGLCDMSGNVKEWVEDCWYGNYNGAPSDGSAWVVGTCEDNTLRGGGFTNLGTSVRTRNRSYNPSDGCGENIGFRCARDVCASDAGVGDGGP